MVPLPGRGGASETNLALTVELISPCQHFPRHHQTLPPLALALTISKGQRGHQSGSGARFFRFREQRKDQTPTGVIEIPLGTNLNSYEGWSRFRKKGLGFMWPVVAFTPLVIAALSFSRAAHLYAGCVGAGRTVYRGTVSQLVLILLYAAAVNKEEHNNEKRMKTEMKTWKGRRKNDLNIQEIYDYVNNENSNRRGWMKTDEKEEIMKSMINVDNENNNSWKKGKND